MLDRKQATKTLIALGDPVRLAIVFLLGTRERINAGEIAQNFAISRPAISHHLRVLREANVVESERAGQEVFYWLNRSFLVSELSALIDALNETDPACQHE